MSYVVHVFSAAPQDSPQQAQVLVDSASMTPAADADAVLARLCAFIDALSARYPDLSDRDPDGENDRNAWPEGLPQASAAAAARGVLSIGLKAHLAGTGLMTAIAHAAADQGLQVLDPQDGALYRADRQRIDLLGRATPLPALPSLRKPAAKRPEPLRAAWVGERLVTLLQAELEPAGFGRDPNVERPRAFDVTFSRRHGDVVQTVRMICAELERKVPTDIWIGLSCAAVRAHWLEVFRPRLRGGPEEWPAHEKDFVYGHHDELDHLGIDRRLLPDNWLKNEKAVLSFEPKLRQWLAQVRERMLEPTDGVTPLAHVVLDQPGLGQGRGRGGRGHIASLASQLVLAGLARPQQLDVWIAQARADFNRYQWRDVLRDEQGALLEQLIARVRAIAAEGPFG
jgi:hypothetical protein